MAAPDLRSVAKAAFQKPEAPIILTKAREEGAQRLMMAYALTGLFFMLLPGTFLGVWNLISISGRHGAIVSPAWVQAHGHAQIFGWIGTFILGIGFYSIPKMIGSRVQSSSRGWAAWLLWSSGVLLRWSAGVYQWHWRMLLPLSATFELFAFLLFISSVRRHRASLSGDANGKQPLWVLSVLVGTVSFGVGLLMNLAAAICVGLRKANPAFSNGYELRLLTVLLYAFIVPTIWGFNARWLPVFLGLKPVNEKTLRWAVVLAVSGVLLMQAGLFHIAPWLLAIAAGLSASAFHLFGQPERAPKTTGVHPSFSTFIRIAYVWLMLATVIGISAAYFDRQNGWVGGSRHALTVGFIATMVFAIGQRVLPAFAGMRVLYSRHLMFGCLLLLNLGCTLRVSSEILAYEGYWRPAWAALPWSALLEMTAVTIFAANLVLTFKRPPAHQMTQRHAPSAMSPGIT